MVIGWGQPMPGYLPDIIQNYITIFPKYVGVDPYRNIGFNPGRGI